MKSPFKRPWHFDKFREDAEGEYVKIVGRFEGDSLRQPGKTTLRTKEGPAAVNEAIEYLNRAEPVR